MDGMDLDLGEAYKLGFGGYSLGGLYRLDLVLFSGTIVGEKCAG